MKLSRKNLKQGVVLSLLAFSLTACGIGPDSKIEGDDVATRSATVEKYDYENRLLSEEALLLGDPSCGTAPNDVRPPLIEVIERFNQRVASEWNLTYRAEHPDSVAGIAVRICDDTRIAAYAYPRTVALHTGLLRSLAASTNDNETLLSAIAFVLYHELGHVELGHTAPHAERSEGPYGNAMQERRADAFAAAASSQAGFSMDGADLVFSLLDQMNPDGSLGHPANRRQALSLW